MLGLSPLLLAEPPCARSQYGGGPVWSTGGDNLAAQTGVPLKLHVVRRGGLRTASCSRSCRDSSMRDTEYTLGLRPPERDSHSTQSCFILSADAFLVETDTMDWVNQLGPYQGFVTRTVAWWFVPGLATQTLLTIYYAVLSGFGLGHRVPAGDSPKRPKHYRRAFAIVVLSYLAWTLVSDLLEQPPSFYHLLGVGSNATDAEIKAAYKMFARRNHPDRVGPTGAPLFIQVRDAYEALKHPIKRYGYDRYV